jgi:hypothetical protein
MLCITRTVLLIQQTIINNFRSITYPYNCSFSIHKEKYYVKSCLTASITMYMFWYQWPEKLQRSTSRISLLNTIHAYVLNWPGMLFFWHSVQTWCFCCFCNDLMFDVERDTTCPHFEVICTWHTLLCHKENIIGMTKDYLSEQSVAIHLYNISSEGSQC